MPELSRLAVRQSRFHAPDAPTTNTETSASDRRISKMVRMFRTGLP